MRRKINSHSFRYPKFTNYCYDRVNFSRPYQHTGGDYTGTVYVKGGQEATRVCDICLAVRQNNAYANEAICLNPNGPQTEKACPCQKNKVLVKQSQKVPSEEPSSDRDEDGGAQNETPEPQSPATDQNGNLSAEADGSTVVKIATNEPETRSSVIEPVAPAIRLVRRAAKKCRKRLRECN